MLIVSRRLVLSWLGTLCDNTITIVIDAYGVWRNSEALYRTINIAFALSSPPN